MKTLSERAVTYLNFDISVGGSFVMRASSSPLMRENIRDHIRTIDDPNAHDDKKSIYDIMAERDPVDGKPRIGTLGSGSDYAPFYQYVGVPSGDFSYYFGSAGKRSFYPVYHSQHDTFNWMKKFVDPEFKFHKAMAQLSASLLLHYADSPLLSLRATDYVDPLKESLNALKKNPDLTSRGNISVTVLEESINNFSTAAQKFDSAR